MNDTYELVPGSIASVMHVRRYPAHAPMETVIWLSNEKGAVTGRRDTPLAQSGWPQPVQETVNRYFRHVFSLEHENWKGAGPSPRAQCVDQAKPWFVNVKENGNV